MFFVIVKHNLLMQGAQSLAMPGDAVNARQSVWLKQTCTAKYQHQLAKMRQNNHAMSSLVISTDVIRL